MPPWRKRKSSFAAWLCVGTGAWSVGVKKNAGMNFTISAMLTWTVPSSFGRPRMSVAACEKYMSFSKPFAAIVSQRRLITSSPWVVTFIFTIGL